MRKRITSATPVASSTDYAKKIRSIASSFEGLIAVLGFDEQSAIEQAGGEEIFSLEEINREKTGLNYGLNQDYDTYLNRRNDVAIGSRNGFEDSDEIDYFEFSFN